TLGSSRTCLVQGVDQCVQVALQLFDIERCAANGGVDNASLIGTVLNLTSLGVLHCLGNVGGYRANLGVGHQTTWAQNLAQCAHNAHGVRRGNDHVEIHLTTLDGSGQVVHADDIGARSLGSFGLFALGENGDANRLAGAGRQYNRTTHDLVGFLGVYAQLNSHVDGLIKLGGSGFLDQGQGLGNGIELATIDLGGDSGRALAQLGHAYTPSTVMPMLRAVPAIVRTAASRSA